MATTTSLIGLGIPAEVATRMGYEIVSVTTSADTQGSAGGLLHGYGNKIVLATVNGANGAVTLPSGAGLGEEVEVYNLTATAGRLYPPIGGTLNQLAQNAATALAVNASLRAVRVSATAWRVRSSAAIS